MDLLTIAIMVVALATILLLGFISDGDPRKGQHPEETSNIVMGKPSTVAPPAQDTP